MKVLGVALLAWLIYDVFSTLCLIIVSAEKMGWVKLTGGLKERKKELVEKIIIPLIGTLLTIYYIVVTLTRGIA